jgi:hypothetical protein
MSTKMGRVCLRRRPSHGYAESTGRHGKALWAFCEAWQGIRQRACSLRDYGSRLMPPPQYAEFVVNVNTA